MPDINNALNMVPVDHVARITSLAAISPLASDSLSVLHVTAQPPPSFNVLFSALARYGFKTEQCEYLIWRRKLEQHIMVAQDNALFPLLHFVMDDLPTSTKAPELNNQNTVTLLKNQNQPENMTVDKDLIGLYLAWLVRTGFLDAPSDGVTAEKLPELLGSVVAKAIGRSGT